MNNENMDLQDKFLMLARQYEIAKETTKEKRAELEAVMTDLEVGTMFQDPSTMAVYRIEVPAGTYVEYKRIGYARTAMAGESRGSLSKTEAEAAGFAVPKAERKAK